MIQSDAKTTVARTAEDTFDALRTFADYPQWMQACVRLAQTSPGELHVGSTLQYVHNTGGHEGEMSGLVTDLQENRVLRMMFQDKMFNVTVGFSLEPEGGRTIVSHSIDIEPKAVLARLMSPLIRKGNARQVAANLERLKVRLEG